MKKLCIILFLTLFSFLIIPNEYECIGEYDIEGKIEKIDVTAEKKKKMESIIQLCGNYLVQQNIEKGAEKFKFDDTTKTIIAAMNTVPANEENKASYIPKKKLDRVTKKLFGAFSKAVIGKAGDENDLSNIYIRLGGLIIEHDNQQDILPYTEIKKIYQIEQNMYQAVVDCNYILKENLYYLQTYSIYLKRGNNQYGYIVKDIVKA